MRRNDLASSSRVSDDSLEVGARFREIGLLVIEPAQACLGVDSDGAQRLIDLVSDRGGQLTQAAHARDVRKVGPGLVQLALRQANGCNVHHRTDELNFRLIWRGTGDDVNMLDPFIRHPQSIFVSKIQPVRRGALYDLPERGHIVRVNPD